MSISRQAQISINYAKRDAKDRRNEFVTAQHLLHILLYSEDVVEIMFKDGEDETLKEIRSDIKTWLEHSENNPSLPRQVNPSQSRDFTKLMVHSSTLLHELDFGSIENIVLFACIAQGDLNDMSFATSLLHKHGITFAKVKEAIEEYNQTEDEDEDDDEYQGQNPFASMGAGGTISFGQQEEEVDPLERAQEILEEFCVEIVQKAKDGKIDPLIGREGEIDRAVQVLARRRKNNPVFVGEAGVGKTAIVEGLALRIAEGNVPESLQDAKIYAIEISSLTAGTRFRGDFEERLKSIIESVQKIDKAIIFFDEIHQLIGAGRASDSAVDASNILKPSLADGSLRCIGATTYDEYRKNFEKDKAMVRRFQNIDVPEPSLDDTKEILKGLLPRYEEYHNITFTEEAIDATVKLAAKHIRERALPDKAIDVIDEAGARHSSKIESFDEPVVDIDQIESVVAKIARIPEIRVKDREVNALQILQDSILKGVHGQDHAVEAVVGCVKMNRAGLTANDKPTGSFLFAGPTGVGKTELAKCLASSLGVEFVRFDMSEYMDKHTVSKLIGSPPGFVGHDDGGQLVEAIRKNPHSVVLLDEIEKAHEDIYNILLQVMDDASLTDNKGRKACFKNVILIMTSNVGASSMTPTSPKRRIGFSTQGMVEDVLNAEIDGNVISPEIEAHFSPEFRNRLDGIVTFKPLGKEVVMSIVDKFLGELQAQLDERAVTIHVTQGAKEFLAERGHDPKMGARPLGRLIQKEIKIPLSEAILFGSLREGGKVTIKKQKDGIAFDYESLETA